jgi:hypothetical protein
MRFVLFDSVFGLSVYVPVCPSSEFPDGEIRERAGRCAWFVRRVHVAHVIVIVRIIGIIRNVRLAPTIGSFFQLNIWLSRSIGRNIVSGHNVHLLLFKWSENFTQ